MRIGEFAEKYQLSVSAVRYYISLGLLIPISINNRYQFCDHDAEDVVLINQFKKWGFSLEEIAEILKRKRIDKELGVVNNLPTIELLEKYQIALKNQIKQFNKTIEEIEQEKQSLKQQNKLAVVAEEQLFGVSVKFLPYFYCPHCNSMLNLKLGLIVNAQIQEAKLSCLCGYKAKIEKGILILPPNKTPGLQDNSRSWWCYDHLAKQEINSLYKICNWLQDQLKKINLGKESLLVLENYISNYCFVHNQLDSLNPNNLYILSDYSLEVVLEYKKKIAAAGHKLNIVFVAGNNIDYPLPLKSLDVCIDYFKNTYFANFNDHFYTEEVLKFLKPHAKILGAYTYVKPSSKSIAAYRQQFTQANHNNRLLELFKESLHKSGVKIDEAFSDDEMLVSTIDWHVNGEPLKHWCYVGEVI